MFLMHHFSLLHNIKTVWLSLTFLGDVRDELACFGTTRAQFHQHSIYSFYPRRSQKHKKTHDSAVFFSLLGSTSTKAVRRMLMKLTPGVNFIDILGVAYESNLLCHCELKIYQVELFKPGTSSLNVNLIYTLSAA